MTQSPAVSQTQADGARSDDSVPRPLTSPASLCEVLSELESPVLSVLTGDTGADTVLEELIVHDASDPSPLPRGAVLLAVGVRPESSAAFDLVSDAARTGVAAVVVKSRGGDAARLAEFSAAAGVALLDADDSIPWHRLGSLISTAIHCVGVATHRPTDDGNLFSLANAIAATLGGAVSIESPSQQILAYSNLRGQPIDKARQDGILCREVPVLLCNPPLYRELWKSTGVVRFAGDGDVLPRVAIAVRAGSEPLGAIFVIESTQITADGEASLVDAAALAAPYLLRARLEAETARRVESDILRAVIDGRSAPAQAAVKLNVSPTEAGTIIAFQPLESIVGSSETTLERIADLALVHLKAFRRAACCVCIGNTVYAYVPVGGDERRRLRRLTANVIERANASLHARLAGGIGSSVAGLSAIPSSRNEADRVLRVLHAQHRDMAAIEDVHSQVVLLELGEMLAARPDLLAGPVRELIDGDDGRGLPYAETLRAYLDCFGDVQAAAEQLCVHANTFRYRLRRVRELFGIDLTDPDQRLVLALQLRLARPGGRSTLGAVGSAQADRVGS